MKEQKKKEETIDYIITSVIENKRDILKALSIITIITVCCVAPHLTFTQWMEVGYFILAICKL